MRKLYDLLIERKEKEMKEKVDRILNGEAVDIARADAEYYLCALKAGDRYKISFESPGQSRDFRVVLDTKQMREAGKYLIALADELESRKKFKSGDRCVSICPDGSMYESYFNNNDSGYVARVAFGNVFKTWEEARANKDAILAKYQELRDKGLV